MARFELVIFDCDGVVVDSERITHDVFGRFIRGLGADLDDSQMNELFLGRRMDDCLAIVADITGRTPPADALDRYRAERDLLLREQVEAVPGVRAVLEALTVPYCLASSGDHDKMRATLGTTRLLPFFAGRIFSATEVARGKPAPDVFLHAARLLGVDAADCLAFEDAPLGVASARNAGMCCVAVTSTYSGELLSAGSPAPDATYADFQAFLDGAGKWLA